MFKNIKTKLLFWYSITIILVLAIFSHLILDEFTQLILAKSTNEHINTSIHHLETILIEKIPLLLIISIIIGYFIIKITLLPVKKTIDEVKKIEANKLQKRLTPYTKNDEIEELIFTFNFMLDKLDEAFSKIKRFSNDVSHELKTPLTIIRGEIELGLRKERSNEEYKKILQSTLEETKSLQEIVSSLLFLSKSSDEEIKKLFENISIDSLLLEVISSNKTLINAKKLQLDIQSIAPTNYYGHAMLIKILLTNIINNAIKYSHKNSKVDISLKNNILTIKDYGIGIEKKDQKNIFDRFYRVDKSRNKNNKGGYGLGLSIVKNIADLHNIKIEVDSQYKKYTQFSIFFT